ncbi:MAG: LysM peptidoglycan-binding domain-containing protein [Rhizobiaceae bacterium]|nr:LysM peptidoglycan-binding domain-containing protein [Rhizobiaceae bacterium]
MVANWVKVVWILIGGTAAAAGAAYVGGVFDSPAPGSTPVEAAVQQKPAGQTGLTKDAAEGEAADGAAQGSEDRQVASLPPNEAMEDTSTGGEEAASVASEEPAAPDIKVPVFDLVRVEPDGSVVIAGSAAPGSVVELIAGATVIGTATAGQTGDFAVVLDEPLKPGDYTVVLRATSGDNVVASSTQTAVIAVPESRSGQVLALVEEPGAPSRLITVPSAPAAEKPAVESADVAAAEKQPAVTLAPTEVAAAEDDGQSLAGDREMASSDSAEPAAAEGLAVVAEEPKQDAAAGESQVAAAAQTESKPVQGAPSARVAVEAVEIDGRKVFIAGRTEVGTTVRVYANDILLGQAVASEGGRFLIEADRELPVGDYIVRADMLKTGTADVVARAAVPFEREAGENVAAVAPQEVTAAGGVGVQPATAGSDNEVLAQSSGPADGTAAAPESTQIASLEGDAKAADGTRPAAGKVAAASLDNDAGVAPDTAASDGATAPKLESVGGAVIIRRGDTLWRLSRRVYGRGVRYTTIYLANQEQISDPDRIWPGQVFSVPSETDEGEAADMSAVAEQMADPDEVSGGVVTR